MNISTLPTLSAMLIPSAQAADYARDLALARALGYSPGHVFGPLWRNDPAYVLACLARYCAAEGHGRAAGRPAGLLAC